MEKELIRRYFENRVSPQEKERVAAWLTDPENEKEVLEYITHAYTLESGTVPVASFESLFAKVEKAEKRHPAPAKVISLLKRRWMWTASAACVLFLLIGGGLGYLMQSRSLNENNEVLLLNTARTATGQYAQLTLSDGSAVYLGSNSRLSFPKKMNAHPVVYLEGEAYFDLQDEKSAVIVKTRDLVTTAKGSKFNIKAFSKDSTTTVTVEMGMVELRNANGTFPLMKLTFPKKDSVALNRDEEKSKAVVPWMKLTPALTVNAHERATYDRSTKMTGISELRPGTAPLLELRPPLKKEQENGAGASDDQNGFNFYKADIDELRTRIEQKYEVKIELNTGGNHLQPFTGEFSKDAGIKEVLDHVCGVLGLEYSLKDNNVKISLLK